MFNKSMAGAERRKNHERLASLLNHLETVPDALEHAEADVLQDLLEWLAPSRRETAARLGVSTYDLEVFILDIRDNLPPLIVIGWDDAAASIGITTTTLRNYLSTGRNKPLYAANNRDSFELTRTGEFCSPEQREAYLAWRNQHPDMKTALRILDTSRGYYRNRPASYNAPIQPIRVGF